MKSSLSSGLERVSLLRSTITNTYHQLGNYSYKDFLWVLAPTGFLVMWAMILTGPYLLHERSYLSFKESLHKNYFRDAGDFILFFSLTFICFTAGAVFLRSRDRVTWTRFLVVFVILVSLAAATFFFVPQSPGIISIVPHNPFDNVTRPERFINFLFLGDPQCFGGYRGKHNQHKTSRYENNQLAVRSVNSFLSDHYPRNEYADGDVLGLLIPGDCTQTGEDGRYLTPNYLGDYLAHYHNKETGVQLPVYECTGNHDWDAVEKVYARHFMYSSTPSIVPHIKRTNKLKEIDAEDDYGNYQWTWKTMNGEKLVIVALNVSVGEQNILSGQPKNSKTFLLKQLRSIPRGQKFIILTHWIEDKPLHENPDARFLLDELQGREDDLLAIFIGHVHVKSLKTLMLTPTLPMHVGPSPANPEYDGSVVHCVYDSQTKQLLVRDTGGSMDNYFQA